MTKKPDTVLDRFLRYVAVDTKSDASSRTVPSTGNQRRLAARLRIELESIGAQDATVNEFGYVYATIPATTTAEDGSDLPTLGFIAHIDTSPAAPSADVRPQVHRKWQGGPLVLNVENDLMISPQTCPSLRHYIGDDIITTDGTTLLGSDDKAGVAEIVTMADTLLHNPDIPHPRIRIAFTPDEEIGRSFEHFDVDAFGADYAYTVDGEGPWYLLEYENFNAAQASVTVEGISIHPGNAYGVMRNAALVLTEFNNMLPDNERPENTSGYQGFFMLERMSGSVEHAQASYIIRDHNRRTFDAKKQLMYSIANQLNKAYGEKCVTCTVRDSYYNMRERIEPSYMHLIENARRAISAEGGVAETEPIRGGTDGAYLSYAGLPCPNLSSGGHNFHSKLEFISAQELERVTRLLVRIASIYGGAASRPSEE